MMISDDRKSRRIQDTKGYRANWFSFVDHLGGPWRHLGQAGSHEGVGMKAFRFKERRAGNSL